MLHRNFFDCSGINNATWILLGNEMIAGQTELVATRYEREGISLHCVDILLLQNIGKIIL